MTKADHEREVFREFVALANLQVELESIKSESPPLPDISCTIRGELHFFELTRLADQAIANDDGQLLTTVRKTGKSGTGSAHWYSDIDIVRCAVQRKLKTTHETGGKPLHLLVYSDRVIHSLATLELIRPTFRALQVEYQSHWESIWLYDRGRKQILC